MAMYSIAIIFQLVTGEYEFAQPKVRLHIISFALFLSGFLIGGIWLIPSILSGAMLKRPIPSSIALKYIEQVRMVVNILGIVGAILSILYILLGGYKKILLLGTDIDGVDFRFIGLKDVPIYLALPMEVSRRLILPLVLLAQYSINRITSNPNRNLYYFIFFTFFSISLINLDRGPILMLIVLWTYKLVTGTHNNLFKVLIICATIPIVGFTAAFVTFIQYNNLEFDFSDVLKTLDAILINRIILSPVKMAQLWVFDNQAQLIEPLFLQYSRIGVLWGQAYITAGDNNSYLVAPVGIIADTYRNFGLSNMVFVGFFIGSLFSIIERQNKKLPEVMLVPINFIALILVMYLYYGNLFSLGPFALVIFLLIAPALYQILFVNSRNRDTKLGWYN